MDSFLANPIAFPGLFLLCLFAMWADQEMATRFPVEPTYASIHVGETK